MNDRVRSQPDPEAMTVDWLESWTRDWIAANPDRPPIRFDLDAWLDAEIAAGRGARTEAPEIIIEIERPEDRADLNTYVRDVLARYNLHPANAIIIIRSLDPVTGTWTDRVLLDEIVGYGNYYSLPAVQARSHILDAVTLLVQIAASSGRHAEIVAAAGIVSNFYGGTTSLSDAEQALAFLIQFTAEFALSRISTAMIGANPAVAVIVLMATYVGSSTANALGIYNGFARKILNQTIG